MEGKMNYSNREKKMEYNCDKIVKSDYGEQFLNESYSIAVVFLKTVNLTHAWQLGTELFTKLKAGLIIRTTMNKYVVLQIWKLITYLNLKKTQKNIFYNILGFMPEYCVYGHDDLETALFFGMNCSTCGCNLCMAELMMIAK